MRSKNARVASSSPCSSLRITMSRAPCPSSAVAPCGRLRGVSRSSGGIARPAPAAFGGLDKGGRDDTTVSVDARGSPAHRLDELVRAPGRLALAGLLVGAGARRLHSVVAPDVRA